MKKMLLSIVILSIGCMVSGAEISRRSSREKIGPLSGLPYSTVNNIVIQAIQQKKFNQNDLDILLYNAAEGKNTELIPILLDKGATPAGIMEEAAKTRSVEEFLNKALNAKFSHPQLNLLINRTYIGQKLRQRFPEDISSYLLNNIKILTQPIVESLLIAGADPNTYEGHFRENTVLAKAIDSKKKGLVELLLKYRAHAIESDITKAEKAFRHDKALLEQLRSSM